MEEYQKVISFLVKTCALLFFVGAMLMQTSCLKDSYRVKLSGAVRLEDQWLELHAEPPLKADKDNQRVVLELAAPLRADVYGDGNGPNKGHGILMPEGDVINPEIQVVDEYGNIFQFVYYGSTDVAPIYGLRYPNELPRDREYKTVRIRVPRPIKASGIYWLCDSIKDLK